MKKSSKAFKIGDKVAVLDEDIAGHVVKINADVITIETSDGFDLNFSEKQLIKIGRKQQTHNILNSNLFKEKIKQDQSVKINRHTKVKKKERFQPILEIDLHIHKLLNSTKGMTKHDILTFQLDTARHKLEFAINKKIQKLVFIHGVGEGVLKMELDYLFGRYDNIKYYDADYQKYGVGATEVYVYQNAKRI